MKNIASIIVDTAFQIHKSLGPGLLEKVYLEIMYYELSEKGLSVKKEVDFPVRWKSLNMNFGYRIDLLVENKIIVELKSVEKTQPVHYKQVLTYLKLPGINLGFLINFGEQYIKTGLKRIVNGKINN